MWMVEINQSEIVIFSSVGDRFDRVAMFFCCTNERRTRSSVGILTPCCDLRQWQNAEVFGKKSRTNCSRGRQASAREMEVELVRGRRKGQNNIRWDQTVQHFIYFADRDQPSTILGCPAHRTAICSSTWPRGCPNAMFHSNWRTCPQAGHLAEGSWCMFQEFLRPRRSIPKSMFHNVGVYPEGTLWNGLKQTNTLLCQVFENLYYAVIAANA